MILLALVAVVAWDGLALDVRDEAILGPLPIPRAVLVRAKLAAMGILAGAVLLALNGPPTILHPSAALAMLRVGVPDALRLMAAHAIVTSAAGLFGFSAVLALRELARAALGGWWPAVSTRLQAALIVVLATAFLLIPGWMGGIAGRMAPASASEWRTAASPPMWFVGLHEVLAGTVIVDIEGPTLPQAVPGRRGACRGAASAGADQPRRRWPRARCWRSTASIAIAVAAFLWNARRPAARARTPRRGGVPRRSLFTRITDATIARTPATQAGFSFTLRTLCAQRAAPRRAGGGCRLRSGHGDARVRPGHARTGRRRPACRRCCGRRRSSWPVSSPAASRPSACRRTCRRRGACAWPGPADSRGYIDGVKRAIVVGVGLPALVVLLLAQLTFLGPSRAIGHFAVGLLVVGIALEARFAVAHPLPFLTSYVAGNRLKAAPIWFGTALFFSAVLSGIETVALTQRERHADAAHRAGDRLGRPDVGGTPERRAARGRSRSRSSRSSTKRRG